MRDFRGIIFTSIYKSQCNALWAVCSVFCSQGSLIKRVESKFVVMEECSHTKELLFEVKERLVEHLQTELIEVKTDKDRLLQLLEQQKLTVQHLKRRKRRSYSHHLLTNHCNHSSLSHLK